MKNTFDNQCEAQGWNTDSQVHIFTNFLEEEGLIGQITVYAKQYAEMENSVSIDLGVSNLEDFEEEEEEQEDKSFEQIAMKQGWDNNSKLNIMKAFMSENKLMNKLSEFCA